MGNNIFCCRYEEGVFNSIFFAKNQYETLQSVHRTVNKEPQCFLSFENTSFQLEKDDSDKNIYSARNSSSIQHISDREDDGNQLYNFSMFHSLFAVQKALILSFTEKNEFLKHNLKNHSTRRNSCDNIFINYGPIFMPESEIILRCTALAISLLISPSSIFVSKTYYNDFYSLYDERLKPINLLPLPIEFANSHQNPDLISVCFPDNQTCIDKQSNKLSQYYFHITSYFKEVYKFLLNVFYNIKIGPQCAIVALILFERILFTNDQLHVFCWTWRRHILSCIIIASKVLDDQAVWNVDYCRTLSGISVDELNDLERNTLRLLNFNINVDQTDYALYFFELISLDIYFTTLDIESDPIRGILTSEQAKKLGLISCRNSNLMTQGQIFNLIPPRSDQDVEKISSRLRSKSCSSDMKHLRLMSDQATKSEKFIIITKSDISQTKDFNLTTEFDAMDEFDTDYSFLLNSKQMKVQSNSSFSKSLPYSQPKISLKMNLLTKTSKFKSSNLVTPSFNSGELESNSQDSLFGLEFF